MSTSSRLRHTAFALLGAAALVANSRYAAASVELAHRYGGNVTASFATYFVVRLGLAQTRLNRLACAAVALLIVGLFEATDGFVVMSNVYDRLDHVANAVGVLVAVVADVVASRLASRREPSAVMAARREH